MADNLSTATQASQYRSRVASLDNLGTAGSQFEDVSTSMQKVAGDFIQRIQQRITDSGTSTTGASSNLTIQVIDDHNLTVSAPKSLVFQSYGVNGLNKNLGSPYSYTTKRPPIDAIKLWIKNKQIQSVNNPKYYSEAAFAELTEEEKINNFAWAISSNVFYNGIEPKFYIQPEVPKLIEDLIKELAGSATQTVLSKLVIQIPESETRGLTRVNAPSSPNPNVP